MERGGEEGRGEEEWRRGENRIEGEGVFLRYLGMTVQSIEHPRKRPSNGFITMTQHLKAQSRHSTQCVSGITHERCSSDVCMYVH